MDIWKLINRLGNIRIAGFRLKLGYRRKPLHEDMYDEQRKAREGKINVKKK